MSFFDFINYLPETYDDGFPLDEIEDFDDIIDIEEISLRNTKKQQLPKVMAFEEFIKYIYSKIDPDQAILVTKEMFMRIEKAFIEDFGQEWIRLTRDDKRKKERVLKGLYKNVNLIHEKIEKNPSRYLRYVKDSIIKKYIKDEEKKYH